MNPEAEQALKDAADMAELLVRIDQRYEARKLIRLIEDGDRSDGPCHEERNSNGAISDD